MKDLNYTLDAIQVSFNQQRSLGMFTSHKMVKLHVG